MSVLVNLDNLHSITGGDVGLETELFASFTKCADDCILKLSLAADDQDQAKWRENAHALKGLCYNMGAEVLGQLCREAQDSYQISKEQKSLVLGQIKDTYIQTQEAIGSHLNLRSSKM